MEHRPRKGEGAARLLRILLKPLLGKRAVFLATFERTGKKSGWKGVLETILLTNLQNAHHHEVADHIWFTTGKGWNQAELRPGDRVRFEARVDQYEKGYRGRNEYGEEGMVTVDYRLVFPTRIINLTRSEELMKDGLLLGGVIATAAAVSGGTVPG